MLFSPYFCAQVCTCSMTDAIFGLMVESASRKAWLMAAEPMFCSMSTNSLALMNEKPPVKMSIPPQPARNRGHCTL